MPSDATISSMVDTCVMNGAIDAAWSVIKDLMVTFCEIFFIRYRIFGY